MKHFDLFVIGGGSGGIASARRAASYGKKVGVAEYRFWGGVCVNVGCVPKKIMWNVANVSELLHHLPYFGFHLKEIPSFNWKELKKYRDDYIKRLNDIYVNNLKNSSIETFKLHAKFSPSSSASSPFRIDLYDPEDLSNQIVETVEAEHVLVATGAYPSRLNIPGEEYTINSDGFFELEEQPKKVAIIGAGYIAVELAGIFAALGTETHLFVRYDYALRKFDDLIKIQNDKNLKELGVQVRQHSFPKEIQKQINGNEKKLTLLLKDNSIHDDFDEIIVATGRSPNVENLGLENMNLKMTSGSHLIVDEHQNTNINKLYALGDVCGKVELTPVAIAAGRTLGDRLFENNEKSKFKKIDYSFVPTVIFSHPPIGTIGYTQEEAIAEFGEDNLKIYNGSCVNLFYGHWPIDPLRKKKTFIKLICLKKEKEKVIGLHIVGMSADEMLQGFAVAIKMGATKADFDRCVAIHPTAAEEVVTLAPWGMSD